MSQFNIHRSFSLENRSILLTGAYGLIGRELAVAFLEQGARMILADIISPPPPDFEKQIRDSFSEERFIFLSLNIFDEASCTRAIELAVEKFGSLDVLINNAAIDAKFDRENMGSLNRSRFENYPSEMLKKSVDVNLSGTVFMTQQACRQMLKQKAGNIINVASTYSLVAPNQSLYDFGEGVKNFKPVDYIASKSFIPNFTRYVATFYAGQGIRCNAVVPHGVFNQHDEKFMANFSKLSPLGRMCLPEELIGPFTYLASDASSYMTGSILVVDGGWTAW